MASRPEGLPERLRSAYSILRDPILGVFAMGIIVNEVFVTSEPRAVAIGVAVSLLGLVPVLRKDEVR